MEEIKIILAIRRWKNGDDETVGEIHAEAWVGKNKYGKIYPFGGECPSFDRMFRMVVKAIRNFLRKKTDWD